MVDTSYIKQFWKICTIISQRFQNRFKTSVQITLQCLLKAKSFLKLAKSLMILKQFLNKIIAAHHWNIDLGPDKMEDNRSILKNKKKSGIHVNLIFGRLFFLDIGQREDGNVFVPKLFHRLEDVTTMITQKFSMDWRMST